VAGGHDRTRALLRRRVLPMTTSPDSGVDHRNTQRGCPLLVRHADVLWSKTRLKWASGSSNVRSRVSSTNEISLVQQLNNWGPEKAGSRLPSSRSK